MSTTNTPQSRRDETARASLAALHYSGPERRLDGDRRRRPRLGLGRRLGDRLAAAFAADLMAGVPDVREAQAAVQRTVMGEELEASSSRDS